MGTNAMAKGRGRPWVAVGASVVLSAGIIYAQQVDSPDPVESPAAQVTPPVAAPSSATAAELLAASVPVDPKAYDLSLPAGVAAESGLQIKTIWVARAISTMFPEIATIGGYRQDPLPWHPEGLAIDVMIPDYASEKGIELGNQIAGYALANAQRWGVLHVIWRQGYYPGVGAPSWMADYGSETLNHFDHVHIVTDGGGYPSGGETYYLGALEK